MEQHSGIAGRTRISSLRYEEFSLEGKGKREKGISD
jgi:hypothetical protein